MTISNTLKNMPLTLNQRPSLLSQEQSDKDLLKKEQLSKQQQNENRLDQNGTHDKSAPSNETSLVRNVNSVSELNNRESQVQVTESGKITLSQQAFEQLKNDQAEQDKQADANLPPRIKVLKQYIETLKEQIEEAKVRLEQLKNQEFESQEAQRVALEQATNHLLSLTNALTEATLSLQQALKDAGISAPV